eukprot:g29985.t2
MSERAGDSDEVAASRTFKNAFGGHSVILHYLVSRLIQFCFQRRRRPTAPKPVEFQVAELQAGKKARAAGGFGGMVTFKDGFAMNMKEVQQKEPVLVGRTADLSSALLHVRSVATHVRPWTSRQGDADGVVDDPWPARPDEAVRPVRVALKSPMSKSKGEGDIESGSSQASSVFNTGADSAQLPPQITAQLAARAAAQTRPRLRRHGTSRSGAGGKSSTRLQYEELQELIPNALIKSKASEGKWKLSNERWLYYYIHSKPKTFFGEAARHAKGLLLREQLECDLMSSIVLERKKD